MARLPPQTIYGWETNSLISPPSQLDIASVIDQTFSDGERSPIDIFMSKSADLNTLLIDSNRVKIKLDTLYRGRRLRKQAYDSILDYVNDTNNVSPVFANLVLLGHISAVESYFREVFRRIIVVDMYAQKACREKLLTYGAALVHSKKVLPDALLEQLTFSSSRSVKDFFTEYLGIGGNLPNSITQALTHYSKVCQLRHCIVHRFGKLGVSNAIKLNWDTHSLHIDKPIRFNFNSLQEVAQICSTVVKEVNNHMWQAIMMRQIAEGEYNNYKKRQDTTWTWVWRRDKSAFIKFYKIFDSELSSPAIRDSKQAYDNYKQLYASLR